MKYEDEVLRWRRNNYYNKERVMNLEAKVLELINECVGEESPNTRKLAILIVELIKINIRAHDDGVFYGE